MSNYIGNLFSFNRSLPEPFKKINKEVNVSSKYGSGTQAKLCSNLIKAINAMCVCMDGGVGAVGIIDHRSVVEYKSSMGTNAYHLAVYDSNNGSIMACVYDSSTEITELYVMNSGNRDGTAVVLSMMPALLEDKEFKENFDKYYAMHQTGFPDMPKATECMGILCDNIYRRVSSEGCGAHIKTILDKSGNLSVLNQTALDAGTYAPTSVIAGEFTIFAKMGQTKVTHAATVIVNNKDFEGKFLLSKRTFSCLEQSLVPVLPEWYIIPQEVIDICKHAQKTTGRPSQMRNFLMRGPAGTGKTMGAMAIAAGLGLPYMKFTCSASTEIYDFIGQIFPETDSPSTGNADLDKEREQLKSMGGVNYGNISKLMKLPSLEDMDFDPQGVYLTLMGRENENATSRDCMEIVMNKVMDKQKLLLKQEKPKGNQGQNFMYVRTDAIKALTCGYILEIQEPSCITQPGVMVGLNSLLERQGSITLPTGEIIRRHPDSVVIVTTNVDYEGCRGLNQSLVDRMSLVLDIELPSPEVMVQRAMSVTGATDEVLVSKMVDVVNTMAEYCQKNSIADGNIGMRSLIDWITSSEITGNVYGSALNTIISKATTNAEDRAALVTSALEPIFAPKYAKKTV